MQNPSCGDQAECLPVEGGLIGGCCACATRTPTVVPTSCAGDCDGNGSVSVGELIVAVNVALDRADLSRCAGVDRDGDGKVAINELITAVNRALDGCQ